MKRIYILLAVSLMNVNGFGQNYRIINSSSKKIFTNYPIAQNAYSIAFDTVFYSGGDSVYINFFDLADTSFQSDTCHFWVGPATAQNKPTFIGKQIKNDSSYYQFKTNNNDLLNFRFNTNPLDTIVFYTDASQKFKMIFENSDTLSVLSNVDSVRFYKIINTDLSGNIINSALNNQQVTIAKNFGLVKFFQVDSFPQLLKPLVLIGNTNPSAGFYQITKETLYDYQVGDEIQYYETNWDYSNSSNTYHRYRKYTVLTKTVTLNSIDYQMQEDLFNVGSSQIISNVIWFGINRNEVIANLPFLNFKDNDYLYNSGSSKKLTLKNYCGIKLWTYYKNPAEYLIYCALDTCWGGTDTGGPVFESDSTYVIGLGQVSSYQQYYSPPFSGIAFSGYQEIVYFKKNGITCGTPFTVGIKEINNEQEPINIAPNPFSHSTTITFSQPQKNTTIKIMNLLGEVVNSQQAIGNSAILDMSGYAKGIYFVQITEDSAGSPSNKTVVNKKIVVQ